MKDRKLLMIPGPIEFEPAVMEALGEPTTSHVAADFIDLFGHSLEMMRQVFLCPDGQPIILAGSGTLAMDSAGANLVEPGDRVLVVNTGYFGDRYATLLGRYGAQVDQVRAAAGGRPSLEEVENALKKGGYKLLTVTQVDTSTGVLADVKGVADLAHSYGALIIVDGVCSVAAEELRMADWGVDLALTASQKAVGVPPGLALLMARPSALQVFRSRKTPVLNYYADWTNWLPVMEAYEARKAAYFGTPAVNLVYALHTSLEQILAEGMEARFARHARLARAFRAGIAALGLSQVPLRPEIAAHTMTAPRYPAGINGSAFMGKALEAGVILAGGLLPEIKAEYFRVGHMGAVDQNDILATLGAIESGLAACGYASQAGIAISAALKSINS
jgi:alanine-glyoxylate transaminase/serine-glyoxylate transaminase/serine-pyruvate transaminase